MDKMDMQACRRIVAALEAGGVALAPTDTVYGLLAAPTHPSAQEKIFALKDRPESLNLQLLLPDTANLEALGLQATVTARALLADRALAAAITFILPLDPERKPPWLAHRHELGVRRPADPRIQAVLAETGPLFATSANAHGRPPGRTVPEILEQLHGAPDAVWDAGALDGAASTVVNFNADPPVVLRWGAIADLSAHGLGHA